MEIPAMRETHLTLPQLALIAGTRGMAGAGIGLLLANRMSDSQRRAVGWTLFLVGALTTIPLAIEVLGASRPVGHSELAEYRPDLSHSYSG
jgi:hypothetical protein